MDYAEDLPFTGDTTPVVNGPHGTYYEEENVAGYWISTNVPPPSTNNLPPTVLQPLTNWPGDFHQLPTIAFVHSVEQNDMHQGYWPTEYIPAKREAAWRKFQPKFDADPDLRSLAEAYRSYFARRH